MGFGLDSIPDAAGPAAEGAGAATAAGAGAAGAAGAPAAGAGAAAGFGWFIISIVPLNFGAAAPLMLKPHFVHEVAVSVFLVPQFGQNKSASAKRVVPAMIPCPCTVHANPPLAQAGRADATRTLTPRWTGH